MDYVLKGLFRIPCRFNLRKFPFAIQTCSLNFEIADFNLINFVKTKHSLPSGDIKLPSIKVVGEYEVIRCYSKLPADGNNISVTLYVELAPFYSYHLLNSFFTSLLILLISFSTFFYRINDFSDRIMVSLTALLVLTGFFAQANSNTVQTPYLKLLDIWYAVLIFCTFLNVVIVSVLNSLKFKMKANIASCSAFKMYGEKDSVKKKILKYNYIAFAILIVGFSIFLFFFVLFAADII